MAVLKEAGDGKLLNVSGEVVIRHASEIYSAGRTLYHCENAAEFSIHALKKQSAWKPGALKSEELFPGGTTIADTIAFVNPLTPLTSGSRLRTFAAAFDNYMPPTGARLLKSKEQIARPEQKGVPLLRDIIRLLAPKKTDIIVDLFAGTMSTVAAALLEEHPVYACEPDETCFEAASARIHALQYRRVANRLVRDIDTAHAAALQTIIPLCRDAVDILDGEVDQVEPDQVDQVEPINAPAHPTARHTEMEE
jgi:DNA modification methylase